MDFWAGTAVGSICMLLYMLCLDRWAKDFLERREQRIRNKREAEAQETVREEPEALAVPVVTTSKLQALNDLRRIVPEHWVEMLEPYVDDNVHTYRGDPNTSQDEYRFLLDLERVLAVRYERLGGIANENRKSTNKYDALLHFVGGALRQVTGARQQYEQLMFDGTPMDMHEDTDESTEEDTKH